MRWQTKVFVQEFLKTTGFKPENVLEVGSLDVNGTVREALEGMKYTGLDMRAGANVDVVCDAHDIKEKFTEGEFDLVLCFDTLEHDAKFWLTVENMRWVLKKGGYMVIGVPSRHCPYHEHPSDYWRFMEPAMKDVMLEGFEDVKVEVQHGDESKSIEDEVYGYGRKPDEDLSFVVVG